MFDINNYDERTQNLIQKLPSDIYDYLVEALNNGCILERSADSLTVATWTIDFGEDFAGYFSQSLYGDPTEHTYFNKDVGPHRSCTYGLGSNATGIPIWNVDALIDYAGTCPDCGRFVGLENMENYIYSGYCCSDCIQPHIDYINSKPSGYWTS